MEISGDKRVRFFSRHMVVASEMLRAIDADVGAFIESFVACGALTAENFSRIWHERKFAQIWANIRLTSEVMDFGERVMAVVKNYLLPPYEMRVRTAAVFLMRALFVTQPLARRCHVILAYDDLGHVGDHVKWMMTNDETDALILMASFVKLGGFYYALEPYPRDPEFYKEYRLEAGDPDKDMVLKDLETAAVDEKLSKDLEDALKEFMYLSEKYCNVSKLLAERLGPERAKNVFSFGTDPISLPSIVGAEAVAATPGSGVATRATARTDPERGEGASVAAPPPPSEDTSQETILDRRRRLREMAMGFGAGPSRDGSPKPSTSSGRQ